MKQPRRLRPRQTVCSYTKCREVCQLPELLGRPRQRTTHLDAGAEFFLAHFRAHALQEDVASGEGAHVNVLCGRQRVLGVVRQVDESLSEAGGGGLRRLARIRYRLFGARSLGRTRARSAVGTRRPGPAGGARILTRDRVDGTRGRVYRTGRRFVLVRARRQGFP